MQKRLSDAESCCVLARDPLTLATAIALLIASCSRPSTVTVHQQIDMATPWTMHTIVAGASSGQHVGADGVDIQHGVAAVPWEQGNATSLTVLATGVTTTFPISQSGPEDAKLCDLDKDGLDDLVIVARARMYVVYGGTSTPVSITASQGHATWIQAACGDSTGNGTLDIFAGSYGGSAATPAVIALLHNPGTRVGTAWTFEQLTYAGWTMSVIPYDYDGDGDLDLVVTDRAGYKLPGDTVPRTDLTGSRWIEHVMTAPAGWTNHTIFGSPYTGDEMFGRVLAAGEMLEGRSHAGQSSTIATHGTTSATLYVDTNTGRHYQGADVGDIDQDGLPDIAVSTWESNTCCSDTVVGVYWLRNNGDGTYTWGNVGGGTGTKYDNMLLYDVDGDGDLDVVDTEQINQLGLVWFENPLAPVAPDSAPDAAVDAPHECGAP